MSKHQIDISVTPQYLPDKSRPEANKYYFVYHITFTNNSDQAVTVLNRYWIVIDGNNKRKIIQGQGVVGKKPVIPPGESFSYTSDIPLPTPYGVMEGNYQMINEDGKIMDVHIPTLVLMVPGMLH